VSSGVVSERKRSKCTVEGSVPKGRVSVVAEEGVVSDRGVANAGDITKECATADGSISRAFCVIEKRDGSGGRIETAGRIVEERCRSDCRVLKSRANTCIADVEKERARTDCGVVAAVAVAPKRKPAYGCVAHAGGEIEQGVLSFRRVETGIASIRWWNDRPSAFTNCKRPRMKRTRNDRAVILR
jgi:hypothetical protein